MIPRIEIKRLSEIPESLREELHEWQTRIFNFPVPSVTQRAKPEWVLLLWDDDMWVCSLTIFPRMITVGSEPMLVGGIADVMTRPSWRKRGYAALALNHATEFIRDDLNAVFAMVFAVPEQARYYALHGWQAVPGPTTHYQPTGRKSFPSGEVVTMVYACKDEMWEGGLIDLCGLPW